MRISIVIDTDAASPTISVDDGGVGSPPAEGESSRPQGARAYAGSSDGGAAPQVPGGFAEPTTFTSPPPPAPIVGQAEVDPVPGQAGVDAAAGYAGSGDASSASGEEAAISAGAAPIAEDEGEHTQVVEQGSGTAGEDGGGAASRGSASRAKKASAKRTTSTAGRGSSSKG